MGGPTASNKPGRSWIRYVLADAEDVRRRMLDRMRALFPNWNPNLEALEAGQDYATAFIDAFVHLSDVVAIYQDDHANQSFLRTASRESVLTGLAELVDYRPAPGVAASSLQVFLLAEDAVLEVPVGQQLEGPPDAKGQPLIYEVQHPLSASFAKNALRISGFDRSLRIFNAVGEPAAQYLRLAEEYSGLAAGTPLIFGTKNSQHHAVALAAFWLEDETTTIQWSAPATLEGVAPPIADLEILGKPEVDAVPVAAARADELRAGETWSRVENASLFSTNANEAGLLVSGGLMEPIVVRTGGATIHWDRPLTTSLRKSQTVVYRAFLVDQHVPGHMQPGFRIRSQRIPLGSGGAGVQPGDQLVIVDDIGALRVGVSAVANQWIYLSEPIIRRFYGLISVFRVRFDGVGANPSTPLLSNVLPSQTQQLSLATEIDGLEVGGEFILADGDSMSVHNLQSVAVFRGQTLVAFSPPTARPMALTSLRAWSRFALNMRPLGFDRSEAFTAPETTELTLVSPLNALEAGDYLVVSDAEHAEGVRVTRVSRGTAGLNVDFAPGLEHAYSIGDAVVHGNVAPIEHGATTVGELLGSGAKGTSRQTFELSKSPLTFVTDGSVEGGAKAAVDIWVDGRRLRQVRDLAESGPTDPHFVVKTQRDQRAQIMAGDGLHGMRLISGRDNVLATYRVGLGAEGNVDPRAITKAKPGPAGLESTFNALAAGGGEDREGVEEIRASTPLVTQTLDRAVSLEDYALLARAFAGVAKARADWQLDGLRRVVRLTVGAEGGERANLELKAALSDYLEARSSGSHRVSIVDFQPAPLRMVLRISVAADYRRAEVKSRFEQALRDEFFAYDARGFGEPAVLSRIYAMGEAFSGIDWLIAEAFHLEGSPSQVKNVVAISGDELITGGEAEDHDVGILVVHAQGGLE